jgi:YggT family protein
MDVILVPLFYVLMVLLNALFYVVIAQVILSWLFAFNIINTYNRFVNSIADVLYRITEPLLRPIRQILPPLGGIDFSSFILILGIIFLQKMLTILMMKF